MFIAWDQQPVKGRGGGPPLLDDRGLRSSGYAPPWVGLRCEHHGTGRSEWTPFVVREERRDGRLHQELVFRLPSIRSCCIADDFNRAAWWHDADWALKVWESGDWPLNDDLAGARGVLLTGLREVIPRPTPAGVGHFADFRADRAAEDLARDQTNRAYWEEQIRRQQDQVTTLIEQHPPDCFLVLGLRSTATLAQVKARHRDLAKLHHPDRGGTAARFRQIQVAYEHAVADLARRAVS